ncbi:MAG: ABC transporter substrate-binding protein [Methylocystaceae bacterium]|nr:ABC transporter substrate-binding protein [Methylocystaceae bacterium]
MNWFFKFLLMVTLFMPHMAHARMELGATAEDSDINVGCLYPLSGYGVGFGKDSIIGIMLALEDIQEIYPNPPKIRVIVDDTKLKTSRSIRLVREFAKHDKVQYICGIVSSGIAIEVTKIIDDLGVFFIGTDNASSRLTGAELKPNYFRMTNNTAQTMNAAAQYIKESFSSILKKRPLKIAFIGPDYDYGYQNWRDFREAMERQGVSYVTVATLWPNLFEVDFSVYIRTLINSNADLIVNEQWGDDFLTFLRQVKDTNLLEKSRLSNFGSGGDYDILKELGDDVPVGLILSARHHVNWPQTKTNQEFIKRFYDQAGHFPSYVAQGAYSGILAIAYATMNTEPPRTPDKIRKALSHIRLKLPEDPDGFSSYMNPADHQIQQVISIGETVVDKSYPPATRLIGNWKNYFPER